MTNQRPDAEFKIEVGPGAAYLIITFLAPMTSGDALKAGPEIMRVAQDNKINKYLFDMRSSVNVQSVASNYFFAYEEIQSFNYPRNSVTAFLIEPSDRSHDFITTAFKNAGYVVDSFTSEEDALKWLLSSRE